MPRQSRIDTTGALHHVIARGIERRRIFDDELDSSDFVENIGLILEQTETTCYAWALIPNHFHLLLKTGPVPIATVMRRLLTGHAVRYNRRHKRHGHLFQNRYKSIVCQEDAYLLELAWISTVAKWANIYRSAGPIVPHSTKVQPLFLKRDLMRAEWEDGLGGGRSHEFVMELP